VETPQQKKPFPLRKKREIVLRNGIGKALAELGMARSYQTVKGHLTTRTWTGRGNSGRCPGGGGTGSANVESKSAMEPKKRKKSDGVGETANKALDKYNRGPVQLGGGLELTKSDAISCENSVCTERSKNRKGQSDRTSEELQRDSQGFTKEGQERRATLRKPVTELMEVWGVLEQTKAKKRGGVAIQKGGGISRQKRGNR